MTSIQPELWVDRGQAIAFYQAAFGAAVLHHVGDGEDIAAQLAIGDAAFWVATAGSADPRLNPKALGAATGRTLLVVDDPDAAFRQAVAAGAAATAEPGDEHGWRLARITDPFGHQWEIGRPLGTWRHRKKRDRRRQLARQWSGWAPGGDWRPPPRQAERVLEPGPPDTLRSRNNLAEAYLTIGRAE